MKRITKFSAVLLALLLLVANIAPAAFAAADAKVQPGETVKLTLNLGKVYGVNGEFTVSNEEDFTVSLSGSGVSGKKCYFFSPSTEPTELTITVTVVAKAAAADGESCTITMEYEDWNATGDKAVERTVSKTVVVDVPAQVPTDPSDGEDVTGPSDGEDPTTPSGGEDPTVPSDPDGGDTPATRPIDPADTIDYSELKKQIERANALSADGYTKESWAALTEALRNANNALNSGSQEVVDKAAGELVAAIDGLKKVDYSKLEEAISKAETLLTGTDLTNAFNNLFNGLNEGKELLNSDSQEAVDAGAKKIEDLIAALEKALADLNKGEQPTDPSTPVEPDPQEDVCNISMHYVWPILFFISLAVNVVFVVLLVLYLVKRKKNQKDDTPLVDYDIGDDA